MVQAGVRWYYDVMSVVLAMREERTRMVQAEVRCYYDAMSVVRGENTHGAG